MATVAVAHGLFPKVERVPRHAVQNVQAAVRQYLAWQGDPEAVPILIAAARYLAAHSPTPRARYQTALVARRLMRGGAVHEDDEAGAEP
jgi:hypothetical protein